MAGGRSLGVQAFTLCLAVGTTGPVARGQTSEPAPPGEEGAAPTAPPEPPEYRALVARALDESAVGRWNEAYALFEQAHAVSPNARTQRGMGVTAFEAGHYVRSLAHLRAALTDARKPLTSAQRDEVLAISARVDGLVAHAALVLEPSTALVTVDGQPALFDGEGRLLLDPGPRVIRASAPGYTDATLELEAAAGPSQIELRLERMGRPPEAAQQRPAKPRPTPERFQVSEQAPPIGAFVLGGAAVVLAGTGAALFALVHGNYDELDKELERTCSPLNPCDTAEIDRKIDEKAIVELQIAGGIAFGLAGAAAVASALLFVLHGADAPDPSGKAKAELTIGPCGGAGLCSRIRF